MLLCVKLGNKFPDILEAKFFIVLCFEVKSSLKFLSSGIDICCALSS